MIKCWFAHINKFGSHRVVYFVEKRTVISKYKEFQYNDYREISKV